MVEAIASLTASAPWPASGGPFLGLWLPWSSMRGRCSSMVNRVVRSTRVPMAELARPTIRSPSQWPGTARSSASAVQIAQRLRRNGDGWLLNEQDREKLPITITNQWQSKVCAGPVVRELAPHGLFVEHESGAFWCSWSQLPPKTREKYQAIAAQAQKNNSSKTFVDETSPPVYTVPASTSVPTYQPPTSTANQSSTSTRADHSTGKTVPVSGYTKKNGAYVAPYERSPPHKK